MSFSAEAFAGTIFEEAERQRIWAKVREEEGIKQRIWDKYGKDPDIKRWFALMDRVTLDLFRISNEGILGINPDVPIDFEVREIRELKASLEGDEPAKPIIHRRRRIAGGTKRKKPANCKRCGAACEGTVEAIAHCKGKPFQRKSRQKPTQCIKCKVMHPSYTEADLCCRKARVKSDESITVSNGVAG